MDAFAVSITSGITLKRPTIANGAQIALAFGSFQALMPLLGWAGGRVLSDLLTGVDHWIAFGLLTFIGCKMIYESLRGHRDDEMGNPLDWRILLTLAVATSIDALAVGVTFAFLSISIISAAVIIGVVTFVISLTGVFAGNRIGRFGGDKMEILGGLVLIGIGTKILVEGLAAA